MILDKEQAKIKTKSDCSNKTICSYCNKETELVWVHGHFQCRVCKNVVESCCEGGEIND